MLEIERCLKARQGTPAEGAIPRLFKGSMKNFIRCINVDFESAVTEDFYGEHSLPFSIPYCLSNYVDIQLTIKGIKNLRNSFREYISVETLDGENKYQAEGLGLQDAKKGVIFKAFPPVLHLQLRRFEYDVEKDALVKVSDIVLHKTVLSEQINDRHEFPFSIDLAEFLDEAEDRSQPSVYKLHGVLVHSGDLHGGHYFALIKPEKDGRWYKFDDDRVTPVTDKEVLEDNYGGDIMNGLMAPHQRTQARTLKKFTNAYMLVYIRETELNTVLAPFTEGDTPSHLSMKASSILGNPCAN